MPGFTGSGAAVTFAGGFSGKYREIGEVENEVEVVDSTTLDIAAGSFAINIPGDNPSPGQVHFRTRWAGATAPPALRSIDTLTITLPKEASGSNNAATVSGTGYLIKRRLLPNLQRNQLNEGDLVFQFNGGTGPAYTLES